MVTERHMLQIQGIFFQYLLCPFQIFYITYIIACSRLSGHLKCRLDQDLQIVSRRKKLFKKL